MTVALNLSADGTLSITAEAPSVEAALVILRDIDPDIDRRFAALRAEFQRRGGSDSEADRAAAGDSPPQPQQARGAGDEGRPDAPDQSQSDETGDVDPGDRMEEDAEACVICNQPVPSADWADLMRRQRGEVLCPAHNI